MRVLKSPHLQRKRTKRNRGRIQTTEERPKVTGTRSDTKQQRGIKSGKKHNAENILNIHSKKPGNSGRLKRKTAASDTQETGIKATTAERLKHHCRPERKENKSRGLDAKSNQDAHTGQRATKGLRNMTKAQGNQGNTSKRQKRVTQQTSHGYGIRPSRKQGHG